MPDPNISLLEDASEKLAPLLHEVVFVGGAMLGLLITDAGAAPVRATTDIDVICEITTYAAYVDFSVRLRNLHFTEDTREGAPICRWISGDLTLDVMPLEKEILGFTNAWYGGALQSAQEVTLANGLAIQVITAPYFLGTKIEAYRGRGKGDFHASRDLDDFVAIVDGRENLIEEITASPRDLCVYLAAAANELLAEPRFIDALPGYLLPDEISQRRLPLIKRRLAEIVAIEP
jgi:predicted nucleotidyltransferase